MQVFFFRFYLSLLLVFLLVLSFFISKQLLILFLSNFLPKRLLNYTNKNNIMSLDYLSLFNCYLYRRDLMLSISLCECCLEYNADVKVKISIFMLLAYLYRQKSFYSIAEYYYFKIVYLSYNRDAVISILTDMYNQLNYNVRT